MERSVPNSGYWRVLVVRDAGPGDAAGPGEGGVEPRRGEARIPVSVPQIVSLDRVADEDREQHRRRNEPRDPTPRKRTTPGAFAVLVAIRRKVRTRCGGAGLADGWARHRPLTEGRAEGGEAGGEDAERRHGRQQGETEDERRGQVPKPRFKPARHPLRPRGGGRRHQPRHPRREPHQSGERQNAGHRGRWAENRTDGPVFGPSTADLLRSATQERRNDREEQAGEREGAENGPEDPKAAVEAREEPFGPDRAVGQIREDAVRFAAPERLFGRGQVDRTEMVDPGQRVTGMDQIAQVPVATAREGHAARTQQRPPPPAARRKSRQPEHEHRRRQEEVELGPRSKPDRQADGEERARREPVPRTGPTPGELAVPPAIDENCGLRSPPPHARPPPRSAR